MTQTDETPVNEKTVEPNETQVQETAVLEVVETIEKPSLSLQFASLMMKAAKGSKLTSNKLATAYMESCLNRLPATAYMSSFIKPDILIHNAKLYGINISIPQAYKEEGYNYLIVEHKVVASKNFFFHFNPLKPIYLGGKAKNTEYYDPKVLMGIPNFIKGWREIMYRQLPIEVKLQCGLFHGEIKDEMTYWTSVIEEIQSGLGDEIVEIN